MEAYLDDRHLGCTGLQVFFSFFFFFFLWTTRILDNRLYPLEQLKVEHLGLTIDELPMNVTSAWGVLGRAVEIYVVPTGYDSGAVTETQKSV
jgi:hypothetical protein